MCVMSSFLFHWLICFHCSWQDDSCYLQDLISSHSELIGCSFWFQEKQLRVNMGISKLREKVKEHQEFVGQKVCAMDIFLWRCLANNSPFLIWVLNAPVIVCKKFNVAWCLLSFSLTQWLRRQGFTAVSGWRTLTVGSVASWRSLRKASTLW